MNKISITTSTPSEKASPGLGAWDIARFFGAPPLIQGEDPAQWEAMRKHISAAVGPLDFLEEIWVNDVVYFCWDVRRLRRLKVTLFRAAAHDGMERLLGAFYGQGSKNHAEHMAKGWMACKDYGLKAVEDLFASSDATMEMVTAQTLVARLDEFERIERLMASAEARRDIALHEIERHRSSLGPLLRKATEDVIDAEFEVIDAKPIEDAPE